MNEQQLIKAQLKRQPFSPVLYKRFRLMGNNAAASIDYARVMAWAERNEIKFAWPWDNVMSERYCELDGSTRHCDPRRCTHTDNYIYGCVAYDGRGEYESPYAYPEPERVLAAVWGVGTGQAEFLDSDVQLQYEADEAMEAFWTRMSERLEEGVPA
jgi:hypothetical protein